MYSHISLLVLVFVLFLNSKKQKGIDEKIEEKEEEKGEKRNRKTRAYVPCNLTLYVQIRIRR